MAGYLPIKGWIPVLSHDFVAIIVISQGRRLDLRRDQLKCK